MFLILLPPPALKKRLLSHGICQSWGSQGTRGFTKGAAESCCDSGPVRSAVSSHTDVISNLSQQRHHYKESLRLIKDKHCSLNYWRSAHIWALRMTAWQLLSCTLHPLIVSIVFQQEPSPIRQVHVWVKSPQQRQSSQKKSRRW